MICKDIRRSRGFEIKIRSTKTSLEGNICRSAILLKISVTVSDNGSDTIIGIGPSYRQLYLFIPADAVNDGIRISSLIVDSSDNTSSSVVGRSSGNS